MKIHEVIKRLRHDIRAHGIMIIQIDLEVRMPGIDSYRRKGCRTFDVESLSVNFEYNIPVLIFGVCASTSLPALKKT